MKKLTLEETEWRTSQIDVLEEQLKTYRGVADRFFSNFKRTHTKGNLNNTELDFMLTAGMVHDTFIKASTQYGIAINIGDRDAVAQARNYIQILTNWHIKAELQLYFLEEYSRIKDLTTLPELTYYTGIKK